MSKILEATCQAGVVTCEGVPVPGTKILSKGLGQSEGALLLEGEKKTYLTSSAQDLELTIDKVILMVNKIAEGLTAAGSALDGIAPGSGTAVTAAAAQLAPMVVELQTVKGQLK